MAHSLSRADRLQLAKILDCSARDLPHELVKIDAAARDEYVQMILGKKVFTRGQDIREWRLLLMIQHVWAGQLPSERTVSALFQTSSTQSRSLLRAVMSKYQYELRDAIHSTLTERLRNAVQPPGNTAWVFVTDSENEIDALNREVSRINGTLPQVTKRRSTVSTYEIDDATYQELIKVFVP